MLSKFENLQDSQSNEEIRKGFHILQTKEECIKQLKKAEKNSSKIGLTIVEQNGEWFELETLIDNFGFNEIGYIPDKNDKVIKELMNQNKIEFFRKCLS